MNLSHTVPPKPLVRLLVLYGLTGRTHPSTRTGRERSQPIEVTSQTGRAPAGYGRPVVHPKEFGKHAGRFEGRLAGSGRYLVVGRNSGANPTFIKSKFRSVNNSTSATYYHL